ncbi:putative GntR family transcriptional regulator [Actinacidiphila reveromycinica]|uniref:Putative GntR family transcriptional regulator n=1 Tax=Actinacidiphila reveromycinica TaxID=659352 RepID=A0A7U3VNG2_9ACTN|nr:FCD domain-containing protein [Streptomyces sp. SN-593]BBA97584.1 putative GntR family transcriptional regulator [Streptomyces sp. SN-593]
MVDLRAPQRKASLSAQLVESLREHITTGQWPVGTRLPSEHELVERLGVSRTTLREALGALTHLGLLEARAGDGTYVRAASELEAVLVRRAASSPRDDVLELRAVLEEYAAGLAAARRGTDDLVGLRALLEEADGAGQGGTAEEMAEVDGRFHQAVVRAGGNPLLAEVYDHLGHAITASLVGQPFDTGVLAAHARLHQDLVAAIEARDETGARHAAARIVALNHAGHEEEGNR